MYTYMYVYIGFVQSKHVLVMSIYVFVHVLANALANVVQTRLSSSIDKRSIDKSLALLPAPLPPGGGIGGAAHNHSCVPLSRVMISLESIHTCVNK